MQLKTKQAGFSLIEIALALLLIGILLGTSVALTGAFREGDKRTETKAQMVNISEEMNVYLTVNKHLPCPDTDNDGRENRHSDGIRCRKDFGRLPYLDLSVDKEDAWGNPFYYKVNERADKTKYITDICEPASVFGSNGPRVTTSKFAYCASSGTYFCNDACGSACNGMCDFSSDPRSADAPPYFHFATQPIGAEAFDSLRKNTPDPKKNLVLFSSEDLDGDGDKDIIANSIVAMIVSFGENGQATWEGCNPSSNLTASEIENCNDDRVFEMPVSGDEADFLTWMTINDAKQVMINRQGFSE